MASCTVKIELDHPDDEPLHPGDELTGTVVVETDAPVSCRKLSVDMRWRTRGRGNINYGPAQHLVLFEGEWEEGELQSYPFRFTLPNGPATFYGHLVNVVWEVRANVDIPWAFDPHHEVEFQVEGARTGDYDHGPSFDPTTSGRLQVLPVLILMSTFTFPSCLILFFIGFSLDAPWLLLLFLCPETVVLAVMGFLLYRAARNMLAERRLGTVDVQIPEQLEPGDTVDVLVHCEPRRTTPLNKVTLTLRCREKAVSGSGTNRTTHTHTVWSDTYETGASTTMEAGEPAVYAHSFTLPADAAPSFAAPSNELIWEVEVHFDIPGAPDWGKTFPLTVRPSPV